MEVLKGIRNIIGLGVIGYGLYRLCFSARFTPADYAKPKNKNNKDFMMFHDATHDVGDAQISLLDALLATPNTDPHLLIQAINAGNTIIELISEQHATIIRRNI